MKLYDMIQVYSRGSTVIMHMHYIWPVLHMTSCLVAINKNRDLCFDMKKGKKIIFQWGNLSERLSECVVGIEIYKINLKKKNLQKGIFNTSMNGLLRRIRVIIIVIILNKSTYANYQPH